MYTGAAFFKFVSIGNNVNLINTVINSLRHKIAVTSKQQLITVKPGELLSKL